MSVVSWRVHSQALKRRMADPQLDFTARTEGLLAYLTLGFVRNAIPGGAGAAFPGAPSIYGKCIDRMQAFSRMAPLWAAYIAGGRAPELKLPDGTSANLPHLLAQGLSAGCDTASSTYWGAISDFDQRLCEAADIALACWLARAHLEKILPPRQRDQLHAWLLTAMGKRTADNNWHVFVLLITQVLASLGVHPDRAGDDAQADERWRRLETFHLGCGWYRDGPAGPVDYYNAWGFQYGLFWLSRINPSFEGALLEDRLLSFARHYLYLITPQGFPAMGRSLDYRMAAPAPVAAASLVDPAALPPGTARRAQDVIWRYFVRHDCLRHGVPCQGYWSKDLRLINNYSGPASSLWSLRGLIIALSASPDHAFWQSPEQLLPVELADFEEDIPAPGWRLQGCRNSGEVKLFIKANASNPDYPVQPYPRWRAGLDWLRQRPARPDNELSKYRRYSYSNLRPFWIT